MTSKLVLLLLLLLLSACAAVKQEYPPIRAEGYGSDCTEALKQAKVKAAENYKGTFVSNQRTLINDQKYSESLNEYSGGIVRSYNVVSSKGTSPCFVIIDAQVSPDSKSIIVNQESSIDLGGVERHLNQQSATQEVLRKLIQRPEMIKVESRTIEPTVYGDGSIGMTVKFTKIVPSPKWTTDLESFLAVHGTKYTYQQKNPWLEIGKGLLAIAALPVLIPVAIVVAPFTDNKVQKASAANPGDSFSLCFPGNEEVNCYQGWAANEIYQQLNSATIVAIMAKDGVPVAGFPIPSSAVSLNQHVDTKIAWVDDQNRPKTAFDLVASKSINMDGNLNLASQWVSDGYDLKFRLKFN